MKRKLLIFCFALAVLFTVGVTPAFAGDDQDDTNPPPCSVCDDRMAGNWG